MIKIYFLVIFSTCFVACTNHKQNIRKQIDLEYPDYFPKPTLPKRNLLTEEGVSLGKRLFFDKRLSSNQKISCATCHDPRLSFSDGNALSSLGVSGNKMKRNTPALINLAWMKGLFWDGGVHDLESLPFAALTNPDEMGIDLRELSNDLNSDSLYKKMFKKAFGIDSISSAFIARALAQYQRTLIFSDSKFDQSLKKEIELTKDEQMGFEVFQKKCASCHLSPLFTDNDYHNNGLDTNFPSSDLDILKGRGRITQDSLDLGKYKTPTLRNLKYTAPYMHDGRFASLEEVLNHYQVCILKSPTLDSLMYDISFSNIEKNYLMIFLNTLNEDSIKFDRPNY